MKCDYGSDRVHLVRMENAAGDRDMLDGFAMTVKSTDTVILKKIAGTAFTGKNAEVSKEIISDIVVKAITFIQSGSPPRPSQMQKP